MINTTLTYLGNIKTSVRDISTLTLDTSMIYKCFVSLVAKQTMSNMAVAMCDVMQVCLLASQFHLSLPPMTESVLTARLFRLQ